MAFPGDEAALVRALRLIVIVLERLPRPHQPQTPSNVLFFVTKVLKLHRTRSGDVPMEVKRVLFRESKYFHDVLSSVGHHQGW